MSTAPSSNITRNYNRSLVRTSFTGCRKIPSLRPELAEHRPVVFCLDLAGGFSRHVGSSFICFLLLFSQFFFSLFWFLLRCSCEVFPSVSKCNKILLMVITIFVLRCAATAAVVVFRFRSVGSSSMCTA